MRTTLLLPLFLLFLLFGAVAQDRPDALREYRNGNYQAAVGICLQELSANPGNLDSYVVLSWSLVRLGRYEEAGTYALKGRELSRYDPRIVQILGEVAYYQGRNVEALRHFQEYVNLAPEGGRIDVVYYFMGELYLRLGRFRHADIALSTAVRYVAGNALWWTRLGYAKENAGELRGAVEAYERALALDPQMGDAQRGIARTRRALGIR